jgi:uncharacterized protein (TIGR02452 family)
MTREERVGVFLETIAVCKQGAYSTKDGHIVMIPLCKPQSKFYKEKIDLDYSKFENHLDEIISVEKIDCLDLAKTYKDQGLNLAVLNMANQYMPGGGVLHGSGAQEENVFRRTTLFETLYQYHDISKDFDIERDKDNSYPMDDNYGGIYSKNVIVFRKSECDGYEPLDNPYMVDFISVAAIKDPKTNEDGTLLDFQKDIEKNKIRTILNIALDNGNDALVLGALGCGAFRTPPTEMAKCFKEVLNEDEFKYKFKRIGFAILDDKNAYKEHNPNGNYKPFKDIFN